MTRVVLVASSPRFPLLFPPQTWRALDAARPVYVLAVDHPSLPALDVGEIPFEVLPVAEDTGPVGRDLLLLGQGIDADQVATARRQADALLGLAKERGRLPAGRRHLVGVDALAEQQQVTPYRAGVLCDREDLEGDLPVDHPSLPALDVGEIPFEVQRRQ